MSETKSFTVTRTTVITETASVGMAGGSPEAADISALDYAHRKFAAGRGNKTVKVTTALQHESRADGDVTTKRFRTEQEVEEERQRRGLTLPPRNAPARQVHREADLCRERNRD